jgi:hypothetical protein
VDNREDVPAPRLAPRDDSRGGRQTTRALARRGYFREGFRNARRQLFSARSRENEGVRRHGGVCRGGKSARAGGSYRRSSALRDAGEPRSATFPATSRSDGLSRDLPGATAFPSKPLGAAAAKRRSPNFAAPGIKGRHGRNLLHKTPCKKHRQV